MKHTTKARLLNQADANGRQVKIGDKNMTTLTKEDLSILENNAYVILIENHDCHATLIFDTPEEAWEYWEKLRDDKRPMSLCNFGLNLAERNQQDGGNITAT